MKLTFNLHRWPEEKPKKSGDYLTIDHYPEEKYWVDFIPYVQSLHYSTKYNAWNAHDSQSKETVARNSLRITLWAELPTIGDIKKLCESSQE